MRLNLAALATILFVSTSAVKNDSAPMLSVSEAAYELREEARNLDAIKKNIIGQVAGKDITEDYVTDAFLSARIDDFVVDWYTPKQRNSTGSRPRSYEQRLESYITHPNYLRIQKDIPHFVAQNIHDLLELEDRTGVDYRYPVAIMALESDLGRFTGDHNLMDTYVSRMQVNPHSRQTIREVKSLLKWSYERNIDPSTLNDIKSSPASAFEAVQTRATNLKMIPHVQSIQELRDPIVALEFISHYLKNNWRRGQRRYNWDSRRNHEPMKRNSGNWWALIAYNYWDVYAGAVSNNAEMLPASRDISREAAWKLQHGVLNVPETGREQIYTGLMAETAGKVNDRVSKYDKVEMIDGN